MYTTSYGTAKVHLGKGAARVVLEVAYDFNTDDYGPGDARLATTYYPVAVKVVSIGPDALAWFGFASKAQLKTELQKAASGEGDFHSDIVEKLNS